MNELTCKKHGKMYTNVCGLCARERQAMTTGEEAGAIAVATAFLDKMEEWHRLTVHKVEGVYTGLASEIEAYATREKNAAIEQERERCAKVADEFMLGGCRQVQDRDSAPGVAKAIAAAIRATSPQAGKET